MTWHLFSTAPAKPEFWAFHEGKREVWPAKLGADVGFRKAEIKGQPDLAFCVHASTGAGFFARWHQPKDEPQSVKNGVDEKSDPLGPANPPPDRHV